MRRAQAEPRTLPACRQVQSDWLGVSGLTSAREGEPGLRIEIDKMDFVANHLSHGGSNVYHHGGRSHPASKAYNRENTHPISGFLVRSTMTMFGSRLTPQAERPALPVRSSLLFGAC